MKAVRKLGESLSSLTARIGPGQLLTLAVLVVICCSQPGSIIGMASNLPSTSKRQVAPLPFCSIPITLSTVRWIPRLEAACGGRRPCASALRPADAKRAVCCRHG